MQLGCMHLNSLLTMTEIALDHENDGVWMELLMGQGKIIEPHDTLANASREVLLPAPCSWENVRTYLACVSERKR